jgi:hypothetical protein
MIRKQPSLFRSLPLTDEAAPRKKKEAGRPRAPKIALIDLNLVRPNPAEPRKTLNEEGLRQLADSIRRHGLLNPILVRREQNGTFTKAWPAESNSSPARAERDVHYLGRVPAA